MVTAGNEVELLTLLFFSVTILEITLLVELCQSHPSSVISVGRPCNKCSYHHKSPLLIITSTTASNLWVLLSCCFSVFPFELMIRSFSSYRIYRCSSWSVSRSWAVSHSWSSWLVSGGRAGSSCGVPAWLPAPPLLRLAALAQLPQLHQAAHDLAQLQPPPVPPEQLGQVPAAKIFLYNATKIFL